MKRLAPLLLIWAVWIAASTDGAAQDAPPKPEDRLAECSEVREQAKRQVARCGTAFQLNDPDLELLRWPRSASESTLEIPEWVPSVWNQLSRSNLADRVDSIHASLHRSWGRRGDGGEFTTALGFREVVLHEVFIETLESAGFFVTDWTSVPSRSSHNLSAGGGIHRHYISASHPATCRSIHVALTEYPDASSAPFVARYDGVVTAIHVAFRAPTEP